MSTPAPIVSRMESAARASASTENDRRAFVDDESSAWLRDLRAAGNVREEAVERLHALLAVLARLDDYRGLSRFTTWAYKFALYQASVKVRRRSWQGREIPVEDEAWSLFASAGSLPEDELERSELLGAIRDGIRTALTPHQRSVLVALALNDVPIDVLAERLQTTRGALYKSLHDARRSLRRHLAAAGLAVGEQKEREQRKEVS